MHTRVLAKVSTSYKLSWGICADGTVSIRTRTAAASLGLTLFWGDPAPLHNQAGDNVARMVERDAADIFFVVGPGLPA